MKNQIVMEKVDEYVFRDYIPFNKENLNGRTYTKDSFPRECVEEIQEKITDGSLFGEIGYKDHIPYETEISLKNVCYKIISVGFYDEYLLVYIRFLSEIPEHLQSSVDDIRENPKNYVIRPRSIGKIDPSTHMITVTQLIAFDIISAEKDSFKEVA